MIYRKRDCIIVVTTSNDNGNLYFNLGAIHYGRKYNIGRITWIEFA